MKINSITQQPYRTAEDVLLSPWAAVERPGEKPATDRVLRSTRLEDSIYADLREGDGGRELTEQGAAGKLPSFPALSRDVFQSFYSLLPRKNEDGALSVAARKFNAPILEHITQSEDYPTLKTVCEGRELPVYEAARGGRSARGRAGGAGRAGVRTGRRWSRAGADR